MSAVTSVLCEYTHRRWGTELKCVPSLGLSVTVWELMLFVMLEGGWSFSKTERNNYGLEIALLDNTALNELFA